MCDAETHIVIWIFHILFNNIIRTQTGRGGDREKERELFSASFLIFIPFWWMKIEEKRTFFYLFTNVHILLWLYTFFFVCALCAVYWHPPPGKLEIAMVDSATAQPMKKSVCFWGDSFFVSYWFAISMHVLSAKFNFAAHFVYILVHFSSNEALFRFYMRLPWLYDDSIYFNGYISVPWSYLTFCRNVRQLVYTYTPVAQRFT